MREQYFTVNKSFAGLSVKISWLFAAVVLSCFSTGFAAEKPYSMDLNSGLQIMGQSDRITEGSGWSAGGRMNRHLNSSWKVFFEVGYDRMSLQQDTVLVEWDWAYWNERYIDFLLTGASPAEVDSINRALAVSFANAEATLHPYQWLNEVRLAAGISYTHSFTPKVSLTAAFSAGASLYERRLKMVELWTKEYSWQWSTAAYERGELEPDEEARYEEFLRLAEERPEQYRTEMDTVNNVEYQVFYTDIDYSITHLAPSKVGTRFFASPFLEIGYMITPGIRLSMGWHYVGYLTSPALDDLFNTAPGSEKWFPFSDKQQVFLNLSFRY